MSGEQLTGQDTPALESEGQTVELQDEKLQDNAPEGTAPEGEADQEQGKPERVFSQAELDAAVQKRLLRERRRWDREQRETAPSQRQATDEGQEQQGKTVTEADVEAYLAKKRSAQALATFTDKAEDAAEKYPDYLRVVTDPRVPFSEEMIGFFAESDVGTDLAYELAKHPEKVVAMRRMSPLMAGREMARLEAELKAKPKATPSKAPDPIRPIGSRGAASTSALPSDEDDINTWMQKERKRVSGR